MANVKKTAPAKKAGAKTAAPTKKATMQARPRNQKSSTEIAQDNMLLSDYDIASDVLGSHKTLIEKYGEAICEISCPQLRRLVTTQLTECASDQLDCFSYMHERGMYKTEAAPIAKIRQARQKFSGGLQPMTRSKKGK